MWPELIQYALIVLFGSMGFVGLFLIGRKIFK